MFSYSSFPFSLPQSSFISVSACPFKLWLFFLQHMITLASWTQEGCCHSSDGIKPCVTFVRGRTLL